MATYNYTHPNYYKITTAIPIGEYQAGVNAGIAPKFTVDLDPIPDSSNRSIYNYTFNFKERYFVEDSERHNTISSVQNYECSLVLPYDVLKIYGFTIQHFSNISNVEYAKALYLGVVSSVTYYLGFRGYISGRTIYCEFGILQEQNGTITGPIGNSCNFVRKSISDIEHVSDGITGAIWLNGLLDNINYLFVTATRYDNVTISDINSLALITNDNATVFGFSYSNIYQWAKSNTISGFQIYSVDTGEIIVDPGYEPPGPPPGPSDDPYSGTGGYSEEAGGPGTGTDAGKTGKGGTHDTTSDDINTPSNPTSLISGSGLFTAYNPDASQLATFANKLWNKDPTTIDDWFRMLFGGDAFNAIIGLHMLPVQPDASVAPRNIFLGNWDTGASAPKIINQYKEFSFGSLTLEEFWGNSIDYSPYTRVQLALPYIGIVDVDTDDVVGSVNTLTYKIDVLTGALCAMLHCVKGNLNSVIYQWSGSCAVQLPITGANYNSVVSAIMGVGAATAGSIAFASGPIGSALGPAVSSALGASVISGAAANMFGTMKGRVQKGSGLSGNSGALGIMTPYFIVTRPVQSIPSTQQATKGYPSNISAHLGDLSGYTEVTEVHLHNIPGTKDEVLEIESLLKKGVIF